MEKQRMAGQPTKEQMEAIGSALASGRKIEAIKIYRDATGLGLKEAKEFIDALIPKLREQDPEKYTKLSQGSGCASVILLCMGVTTASIVWIIKSIT
jgi:ribosomal protein L7/L12